MGSNSRVLVLLLIVSCVTLLSNQTSVRSVHHLYFGIKQYAPDETEDISTRNDERLQEKSANAVSNVRNNPVKKVKNPIHSENKMINSRIKKKPSNAVKRSKFFNNHTCVTQGDPDFPTDWRRRAPHFVLLGAMKAGTETLMYYLRQHEQIVKPKDKEANFLGQETYQSIFTPNGILRKNARDVYAAYLRKETLVYTKEDIKKNASLVASDNTPHYIFWNDVVPARLFCIAPWVKLILLLRDPVERCFSHYTMSTNTRIRKGLETSDFETWIIKDLRRMRDSGLIPQDKKWESQDEYDAFAGSPQEQEAWMTYTGQDIGKKYHESVVGKSLYSIQLRNWLRVMDRVGKPRSDLLVLRSEEMRTNPKEVIDRVIDFIGLPQSGITPDTHEQHHGRYRSTMSNETRSMLQNFFEPYNRDLYKMLGKEWDGVWDKSTTAP